MSYDTRFQKAFDCPAATATGYTTPRRISVLLSSATAEQLREVQEASLEEKENKQRERAVVNLKRSMKQHKRCLCYLLNQKLWSFPSWSPYFWQCRCSFHSSPSPSSQWRRWTRWHASRCCWTSSWSLQLGQSPLGTPAPPAGLAPLPTVPKWSRYVGRLRTAEMNNRSCTRRGRRCPEETSQLDSQLTVRW